MLPASVKSSLSVAATAVPTPTVHLKLLPKNHLKLHLNTMKLLHNNLLKLHQKESSTITSAPSTPEDNPYTIYPSVAKTASINGFADRIYDQLPECAKPCMFQNTGVTPCPYWDTGCLCIMPTLLVPLVLVLLRSVKAKRLFLLQVWVALFAPLLVYGIHTGCFS